MDKQWKELVIARYQTLSPNYLICIGQYQFDKTSAIREIMRETEMGKFLVDAEKQYLQNIKEYAAVC